MLNGQSMPGTARRWLPASAILGVLFALFGAGFTGLASAFDLGPLQVQSGPGEPFRATVELRLLPTEPAGQMIVDKAPARRYAERKAVYSAYLDSLVIEQRLSGANVVLIMLSGDVLPAGEAPEVILSVQWPQGLQEQRFRLAGHRTAAPAVVRVQANETLDIIAKRLSEGREVSYLHMMYALYQKNPSAFYRNNMNNLKAGVALKVPAIAGVRALDSATVYQAIRQHYAAWQAGRGDTSPNAAGAMLSAIPEEFLSQPLTQDTDPEQLQTRLDALSNYNSEIADDNRLMSDRLGELEQQLAAMSERLLPEDETPLETPGDTDVSAVASGAVVDADEPGVPDAGGQADEQLPLGARLSLPHSGLLGMLCMSLLAMVVIWRGRPGGIA